MWEGVWRAVLDELAEAGRLDPSELALDGTFAPARKRATRSASPGVGKGMRIGPAVERNGIPVGVWTNAADVGEPRVGRREPATLPPEADAPADVPVRADQGFDRHDLRDDRAGLGFQRLARTAKTASGRPGTTAGGCVGTADGRWSRGRSAGCTATADCWFGTSGTPT